MMIESATMLPVPVEAPLHEIPTVDVRGLARATIGARPELIWVAVRDCRIDTSYQREVSPRGLALIGQMVAGWDWALCGVITVAELPGGAWEVIDGQHRAIAAATHGGIAMLPALVAPSRDRAARAKTFAALNTARTAVTTMQSFPARVLAGDPVAIRVQEAADAAGVTVLRNPPWGGKFAKGDTLAVATLLKIARHDDPRLVATVLRICARAKLAPISADQLAAVARWLDTVGCDDVMPGVLVELLGDWEIILAAARQRRVRSGGSMRSAVVAEFVSRATEAFE